MKASIVPLIVVALASLIVFASGAEASTGWTVEPGAYEYERLLFDNAARLKIDINITSGSQATLVLLDEANFQHFENGEAYEAVHESTTTDHLTVTVDVSPGKWYVVIKNTGTDELQVDYVINGEMSGFGWNPFLSPVLLVLFALATGVVVAIVMLARRQKGRR